MICVSLPFGSLSSRCIFSCTLVCRSWMATSVTADQRFQFFQRRLSAGGRSLSNIRTVFTLHRVVGVYSRSWVSGTSMSSCCRGHQDTEIIIAVSAQAGSRMSCSTDSHFLTLDAGGALLASGTAVWQGRRCSHWNLAIPTCFGLGINTLQINAILARRQYKFNSRYRTF